MVGTAIRDLGNDKEGYRWTFLIKNNEDRDDYSRVIPWAKWMATSGAAFTNNITTYLDVDQWLRGTAVNVLSGAGDSYGGDGSQHNVQFYVRPSDGKMLYFPHDMDAFHDANRGIVPNTDFGKIIAVPAYARAYYSHLLDIMATTHNSTYMARWANHFGALLPAQPFGSHLAFISQRNTVVMNAVNTAVSPSTPFAITTNGGNNTTTGNSNFTLTGTANLTVKTIMVNGVVYPITWINNTTWSVTLPLASGTNFLSVQGVDRYGVWISNAADTITVTNTGPGAPQPVKINEWMASNAGPGGYADPADGQFQDWIELYNPNAIAVNLSGYTLTDDLSLPARWTIPAGTTIAPMGFLVIWADDEVAQNTPGNGLHAAFQLDSDGESIGLYNASGVVQHTVDFGEQNQNVSQGLFTDGNVNVVLPMPNWTPRYPNTLAGPMKITGYSVTDDNFDLTWTTIPGRIYRVEYTDNLMPPWTPLLPDIMAAGETASKTDNLGGVSKRFYRVRRLE